MKIAIIGMGSVGSTIAYSIVIQGLASVLLMVDQDPDKSQGEMMDLQHCAAFVPPVDIDAGDLSQVRDMDVIVITSGVKRRQGEFRTDLINRNIQMMEKITNPLAESNRDAIFIVVSNPMDLMTLYMIKNSGLRPQQIIGSGTVLDTSRLRHLLSETFSVDARNVHAYIIGEHGETSVPIWSQAYIASIPINDFAAQTGITFGDVEKQDHFQRVVRAGADVIMRKGATFYGIAQSVIRILTAISRDEASVLTISADPKGYQGVTDVSLSVPAVITRGGVKRIIKPALTSKESALFLKSAETLRKLASDSGI
jgi:L-lactate dehydrogenase